MAVKDSDEVPTVPFAQALRKRPPRCDDPTTIFDVPVTVRAVGSRSMRAIRRQPTAEELDQSYEAAMALF